MGGAGGHMWHPFDCPDVNSGQDLVSFFKKSIDAIKRNPAALKIDGVNLSFRLRENPGAPTGYEFVVDRGSMKPLDIEGVTADNADQRFVTKDGSPHGMVEATNILLDIFNSAVPDIMPELEQIGMTQDIGPYSLYFNTEFVLKKINVKEYPFNFIAIHGVNKFVQKGKNSRKGISVEADQGLLDQIRDKVQSFANQQDFRIYTKIPANVNKSVLLEDALNEELTIIYKGFANDPEEPGEMGAGEGSTKPLKVWLMDVTANPINRKVNISDKMREIYPNMGRSQSPYAKNIYLEILRGTAVSDIAAGPEDVEGIVDGAVVMHATRILGNAVLDALESEEFGSARGQEGVVVQDPEICGGTAFKFTGDFIVGGLATSFREAKYKTGPLLENFAISAGPGSAVRAWKRGENEEGGINQSVKSMKRVDAYGRQTKTTKEKPSLTAYVGAIEQDPGRERHVSKGGLKKLKPGYEVGVKGTFEESNMEEDVLKEQQNEEYIIFIPGGFKPPTGGHYSMIKNYDEKPDIRKVFVVTGPKPREGVTLEQSKEIFDIYGGFSDKVDFIISDDPSPMTTCYELIKNENFINQFPNAKFSIGAGDKGSDPQRIKQFENYFSKDSELRNRVASYAPAKAHSVDGKPASASRLRAAFKNSDWESFKKLLPHENFYNDVVQVLNRQGGGRFEGGQVMAENFLLAVPQSFLVEKMSSGALLKQKELKRKREAAAIYHKTTNRRAKQLSEQTSIDTERIRAAIKSGVASAVAAVGPELKDPKTQEVDADAFQAIVDAFYSQIVQQIQKNNEEAMKGAEGDAEQIEDDLVEASAGAAGMAHGHMAGAWVKGEFENEKE